MWTSCCRGRASACPEVRINDNTIEIKDDYGVIVRMSLEQFTAVVDTVNDIITSNSDNNTGFVH